MSTLQEYRTRPHWSYSSLNQFLNICSLQWAFQRLYKKPASFTPVTLVFGGAFHRTLEYVHLLKKQGVEASPKEASALVSDLLNKELRERDDIQLGDTMTPSDLVQQGKAMVQASVTAMDPEEEIVSVSEAFAVPLVNDEGKALERPLVGELDLVIEKDGKRSVVDWKTSARRWPKAQADKSLQPTCYLHAYQALHDEPAQFRFDVTVKNKTPVCEQHVTSRTTDDTRRLVKLAEMAEKMIEAEHFLPNQASYFCGGCAYQGPCQEWHRKTNTTLSQAA